VAFVLVTCEYNHGIPAPLKNALDYLVQEWANKPVGIVSYGGIAAGTRSAQMLKPILSVLKMIALPEAVSIPFFTEHIDETGRFRPKDAANKAAEGMLNELYRWTEVLLPLRQ
jgi:NAD(P)H-dependent FMN reductase